APRNSRELAVRNQFFTPRYVVEFLTDNTLGRLWYEMTRGETQLKDSCSYLVCRPQEIFLAAGEEAPETEASTDDLSQEEMLQQAVYIPYRPLKDPREILMLDPACGSMHFGLYAFDLYEKIYEEAWDLESQLGSQAFARSENLKPLQQTYASREEFLRNVPRLIVECNIHGVDIDSRAVQIAGLSLWLRAQRSWLCQGLKPQQRPQIRKSNVVCAEPMPGEKGMLEEFAGKLKPRVLGQLVEMIFDKMQLAGEAGSLLKIEEEIEEVLNLAREEFQREIQIRNDERNTLFPDIQSPRQASLFDFTDLGDKTRFWNFAEQKLLDALREYAEQADGIDAVQKRLFAQDAARGFAFIDVFRKKYDVVLMNPPFGEASGRVINYLNRRYELWNKNLLCSFIIRSKDITNQLGLTGVIFDRTAAIKSSYEKFRINHLDLYIVSAADTGWNVLDADVETTVYVLASKSVEGAASFFDVRDYSADLKGTKLNIMIEDFKEGKLADMIHLVDPRSFLRLPNSIVGYYFNDLLMKLFFKFDNLEQLGLQARQGHALVSNEHFRLFWELPFVSNMGYESFYSSLYNGSEFSLFAIPTRDTVAFGVHGLNVIYNKSVVLRNPQYQYLSGVGYGKRGDFLDAHILPSGAVFTSEGQAITGISNDKALICLAYLNSSIAQYTINQYCGQHKHCGYVNLLPLPILDELVGKLIKDNTLCLINIKKTWFKCDETAREFSCPLFATEGKYFLKNNLKSLIDDQKAKYKIDSEQLFNCIQRNDEIFISSAELTSQQYQYLIAFSKIRPQDTPWPDMDRDRGTSEIELFLCKEIISQLVGFVVGRWDIFYVTGRKEASELEELFEPLPVYPSGMLQNEQGLPAGPQDVPEDYPLRISWSGILVDDEGQPEDIVARVREAIEVIWKEKAGDIEQEACGILSADSLRDYFRKPGNFFAEHLKRYSKSRRQAPIYWPLSTASGSYTIWLYYQRLSDQTLYRCVNDYIEPKLKQVMESTRQLRQKGGRSRKEERELEELVNMEQELQEFRDELLRVAAFWKPDLNDGVQITAAPLWKLFRLPKWRTTLKETWEKLEKGDYDWANLAYSIWPERVREKCKHDKSLAIAHDQEDIYEEPVAQAKKKGGRGKKNT
ncbi:MAG: BREX-1 system adenine-specific DNA-methyltransferase PglX, partial [Syntrophomonadaceae bacterium]|nr:BREX-1 system adenine-specific DNA-methyltransferase PglX [Syntrophomonadaceae bacterium]